CHGCGHLRDLHPFPTRRSSDLFHISLHANLGESGGEVKFKIAHRGLVAIESLFHELAERAPGKVDVALVATNEEHRDVQNVVQRSEEHTSELQSRENLVCRLLL